MLLVKLIEPPYTEPYVRWWCAMQGAQKMEEGSLAGVEQANLPNHSNAAVVKPMVVSS